MMADRPPTPRRATSGRGRVAGAGGHPGRGRSSTSWRRTRAVALGPSELARRLGLPKSSIANICGALAEVGLVRRVGHRLRPRPPACRARRRLSRRGRQVQEFYEAARLLPTGSEETVQLAILDGLDMTYLARHDGRQPVRLTSAIGRRLPATSTATGKAAPGVARSA